MGSSTRGRGFLAVFPLGVLLASAEMEYSALARAVPVAVGAVILLAGAPQLQAFSARTGRVTVESVGTIAGQPEGSSCPSNCNPSLISNWQVLAASQRITGIYGEISGFGFGRLGRSDPDQAGAIFRRERRESNSRPSAWAADVLPLNYSLPLRSVVPREESRELPEDYAFCRSHDRKMFTSPPLPIRNMTEKSMRSLGLPSYGCQPTPVSCRPRWPRPQLNAPAILAAQNPRQPAKLSGAS